MESMTENQMVEISWSASVHFRRELKVGSVIQHGFFKRGTVGLAVEFALNHFDWWEHDVTEDLQGK